MSLAVTPRRGLLVALLLLALSTMVRTYADSSAAFHANPVAWENNLTGAGFAPAQYRVAVPFATHFLAAHTRLAERHALALVDFLALLIAFAVLAALFIRSTDWQTASTPSRWLGVASFVALLQYALWWLTWYARPETLASTALLALALWLTTHGIPRSRVLTAVALLVLAVMQGFTRADTAFAFYFGVALFCWTQRSDGFALPRFAQLAISLTAALIAASVQLYLARIVYPTANYGIHPAHRHAHPLFMLLYNVTHPIMLLPFALFLAPSAVAAWWVLRSRAAVNAPQAGLMLGAAICVALWAVWGRLDEVRVFLPFAFALAPVIATLAMRAVSAHATSTAPARRS